MSARAKATLAIISFLIFGSGFSYFWLSGKILIRADVTSNCQGTRKVTKFLGKPGSRLVTHNFFRKDLSVHELVVPYLDAIQTQFAKDGINYTFDDIDSFNNRSKRGGGGRSMHAWGTAFDINPQRNPYWGNKKGDMEKDIPDALINIFKQNGFFWGGDWPGNRDPMHFEWYPAGVAGQVTDTLSGQVIPYAETFYDGNPIANTNGQFSWTLPYGRHSIAVAATGYPDQKIDLELACFTTSNVNVSMQPYSGAVAGSISGHVNNYNRYRFFRPGASVYMDDNLVTNVDANGNYRIVGVPTGSHTVSIRFLFVQAGVITVILKPGENLLNADFTLGQ